jgi:hypothetical protein
MLHDGFGLGCGKLRKRVVRRKLDFLFNLPLGRRDLEGLVDPGAVIETKRAARIPGATESEKVPCRNALIA